MSELPTAIGQLDGVSGQMVAVDCDAIAQWNSAAHGALGRQVGASPTGGALVFDGVQAVAWPGRGVVRVRGARGEVGWRHVDVVALHAPPAPTAGGPIGQIHMAQSRLFIGDLAALGRWGIGESLDGKASLRLSGRDAAQVAGEGQVPPLGDGSFGWTEMPEPQAEQWRRWAQQQLDRGWDFDIHFQPHDQRYAAETQISRSPVRAGLVHVQGGACMVLDVQRPPATVPVLLLQDAHGQPCGIRILLETPIAARSPALGPGPTAGRVSPGLGSAPSTATVTKSLKDWLPQGLWPLLPDGKRDFGTRVRDFGQEKFLALVGGCLFAGCFSLTVLGGLSSLMFYILYRALHVL